jgi:hypothetical protein
LEQFSFVTKSRFFVLAFKNYQNNARFSINLPALLGMTNPNGPKQTGARLLLSEAEVYSRYGLGLRFLRRRRMSGTGPKFIKVSGELGIRGGRVFYPVESLEQWLASRPSGGEPGAAKGGTRANG